jgi:hypothetical protein
LLDEQGREPVQSLQCAHCHVTIETLNDKVTQTLAALKEWSDKTDWVQETAQPLELGMHRADVLKQRIERLKASIALDKKAENARELGLSYDDAVKGGVGIMLGGKRIDPASIYADAPPKQDVPETNFGNTAAQPAVQEPVGEVSGHDWSTGLLYRDLEPGTHLYTAPQPVPVKTYHDGKPWPVQPKPWMGLTDEEAQWIYDNGRTPSGMMEMVEAKLKEKNT